MLTIDPRGKLSFSIYLPGAKRVQVVGTFGGWHEQRYDMTPDDCGCWRLEIAPGPGEFLFRYLIDESCWTLDGQAHGTRTTALGIEMSRAWLPDQTDLLAA